MLELREDLGPWSQRISSVWGERVRGGSEEGRGDGQCQTTRRAKSRRRTPRKRLMEKPTRRVRWRQVSCGEVVVRFVRGSVSLISLRGCDE